MQKTIVLWMMAFFVLVSPALGHGKKKSKTSSTKSSSAKSMAIRGKELYRLYQCADCHSINGQGNKAGVSLDKIGTKRSENFLLEQIMDPEKHVEKNPDVFKGDTNLMPPQQLEKSEAKAIVEYLKTLK